MTRESEPADAPAVLLAVTAAEDDGVVTDAEDLLASGGAGWSVFAITGFGAGCWMSCGFNTRTGVGSRRRACVCGVTAAGDAEGAARVFAEGAANSTRRISIVARTGAEGLGRGRKSGFTI